MRPLMPADLDMAVRVLLAVPEARRPALARRLIAEAREADDHRRRTGWMHPRHGGGTLLQAAELHPKSPLPEHCDRAYRDMLEHLIAACTDLLVD
ncbi:DUF7742 family protein [Histidinibacterium aquaticum]|uniref:DUF7742 domain-containing protein n=1 Tax=Histidinibacterium aquaticum TaxID=2613962 RepID=A0A5J5GNC0_9RHOB|nr:hypothetical protein [Histidinibacterium aquaticum]KAA9009044.1 hypothetical protein F3S47_07235 [Histidinibacterium aquaticum]